MDETKTIILESKDKHLFEFSTSETNDEIAKEKAFQKIEELGYNVYDYQFKEIKQTYNKI